LIRLPGFLAAVNLDELAQQGHAYELWRRHPDSGERQVFARSAEALADNPVATSLQVPNGEWLFSLTPVAGWLDVRRLVIESLLLLLLAAAGGFALARQLRMRQALAVSEARYRALYEATPTMMHSIDGDGRIVSVSREWLQTLGYARDEVIGRKSVDFLSEESRRRAVEDVLPEFFRTGDCRDVPYQMIARDGHRLDVLLSAHAERDGAGQITRSLAVIQDITERQRAAQRIDDLLAEQRAIIDNELVGIIRVRERTVLWANPAFARMLGYAPGELDGRPSRLHYPDEASYRALGAAAYPALAAGGVFHAQSEMLRQDGQTVWLDVSGTMLDRERGESLWAFVDVSELKLALNRVSLSEQRMELALAGANLGLWDWHIPSGAFVCNPRMYELIGYAPGELRLDNDAYAALICNADLAGVREVLFAHLRGESPMFEAEYRLRCQDDSWVWVLCRGKVVERDADGRAVRMTGTNLDISERKASEVAIKVREARLANLIAAMADLVIVFDTGGGAIEYFYPATGRHPYRSKSDPRGGTYIESLPADIAGRFVEAISEILIEARPRSFEYRLDLPDGLLISAATVSPFYGSGSPFPSGFLAVVRDVTSKRLNQQEIEALGRRNRLLLESVGEGIFGLDADGRVGFVNPAALAMLGLAEDELLGRLPHDVFHRQREDGSAHAPDGCPIYRALADGRPRHSEGEWFRRKDGSGFPVALNVTPVIEGDRQAGVVVTFQDITERRRAEQEIHDLAYLDPLTGLPNRRLLLDRLQQALAASKRSAQHGALFFIDLDNFKELNDSLGHAAGDALLQQVARRLLATVREVDTVARLGGDEFVLMLENLGQDAGRAASQAQ
jgi:PAS domain S-box-containing protein